MMDFFMFKNKKTFDEVNSAEPTIIRGFINGEKFPLETGNKKNKDEKNWNLMLKETEGEGPEKVTFHSEKQD